MLIDNKTKFTGQQYQTVFEFLQKNTEDGKLDIVSAYFSIGMLAKAYESLNKPIFVRMILGNFLSKDSKKGQEIDLLNLINDDLSIDKVIQMPEIAKKAIKFIEQTKISIRTFDQDFCHAKAYIYKDDLKGKNSYYVLGSSNFTESGLGANHFSKNIELNEVQESESNANFAQIFKWFETLWKDDQIKENLEIINENGLKQSIKFKEYIISLIKKLTFEYSPKQVYFKILFELFGKDILNMSKLLETQTKVLENTEIWKKLYAFQKKGVLSLIYKIQSFQGAVLADAVGLGKTWQALAVIKFFEQEGYTAVILCPKKLWHNWKQYHKKQASLFEKDDLDFEILHHTDLNKNRLENIKDKGIDFVKLFQRKKILLVIDESHNLRNQKSGRYKTLVNSLLKTDKDVRTLLLSATPINNDIRDFRSQIALIVKGKNDGFKEIKGLEISNLQYLFQQAQTKINEWQKKDIASRSVSELLTALPASFFSLTDSLLVARTRKMIQKEEADFSFPTKLSSINIYCKPQNLGYLSNEKDVIDALKFKFYAYRTAEFMDIDWKKEGVLHDEVQRQGYLVQMMYVLLIKRLESSWFAFKGTTDRILAHHQNALKKIGLFLEGKNLSEIDQHDISELDEESAEEIEAGSQIDWENLTLGKKKEIKISSFSEENLENFRKVLLEDIKNIGFLAESLKNFETDFDEGKKKDEKLERLIEIIKVQTSKSTKNKDLQNLCKLKSKKIVIFTSYSDTANYLFEQLQKRKFSKIAVVTGKESKTDDGYVSEKFEAILERFAPYTKLYLEKDWTELYEKEGLTDQIPAKTSQNLAFYDVWKEMIKKNDPKTHKKLTEPLDILITTDCLSEGQNLQDSDLVVNYDIHWNPVRLIQRSGRIDRLGSPHSQIQEINFWLGNEYEDYLKLQKRVHERMKMMTLAGSEITLQLISEEDEKMLEKIASNKDVSWDEIERQSKTISMKDLTMEAFRQELIDFFDQNKRALEDMPKGVFSGFLLKKDFAQHRGLVALLKNKKDDKLHLLHTNEEGKSELLSQIGILDLLSKHKNEERKVATKIDELDKTALKHYAKMLKNWIDAQRVQVDDTGKETAGTAALQQLDSLFGKKGTIDSQAISQMTTDLDQEFLPENFEVIVWDILN